MKTIKISETTNLQLDWLVAKCEGKNAVLHDDDITRCIVVAAPSGVYKGVWRPTTNWSQGGPIIEREGIDVQQLFGGGCEGSFSQPVGWQAKRYIAGGSINPPYFNGPTPLIAAMRCYVASKLGENAEVPEELK